MSLGRQPPEQRLGVALARTLLIIVGIVMLGWLCAKPESQARASPDPATTGGAARP